VVLHSVGINGYTSYIGFNPAKQIGLVVLCSCDSDTGETGYLGHPLYLWLRGDMKEYVKEEDSTIK
jgi:hypothetical protein